MAYWLKVTVLFFLLATPAQAEENFIQMKSPYPVAETMHRLAQQVEARGIRIVARLNHAGAAQSVGQALRPTEVLMFGNPAIGTPLMQQEQAIAIDLPMKVLVFENEQGQIIVQYGNPVILAHKWGIAPDHPSIKAMQGGLRAITTAAIAP